jgi:hypothetical protein
MTEKDGSTIRRTSLIAALGDHAVAARCLRVAAQLAPDGRKGA